MKNALQSSGYTCGRGGGTGVGAPHGSALPAGGLEIDVAPNDMSSKSIR